MGSLKDYNAQIIGPSADYRTPEQHVGVFDTLQPWETCMTIGRQWSWKPDDQIKSAGDCIRILVQCVTGDGNLLLNVGPMPDGQIEPRQVRVLQDVGAWLRMYGESVYGTRGGPFPNGPWGGSTQKGNTIYLHILKWEQNELRLPSLNASIVTARALTGGDVNIAQTPTGITVQLPAAQRDSLDTIVKITLR